ncbi:MAG: rhomboid family intramembrane serine protease [Planctomycetes bacterium]|nr:rhomboid family intramembrane serine protease [Planctomycetota bacterium]
MIPLRDSVPASRTPIVTYAIIAVCAVVWLVQLGDPELVLRLGMVPARVLDPEGFPRAALRVGWPAAAAAVPDWLTLLTCTFLHGGWLHFLGNMLFLWIFGDNVEDRLGRVGFVVFYLGTGVVASAAHLLIASHSVVPTIGASGAIAGVMGAYLLLYPRARVEVLMFIGIIGTIVVPAWVMLGLWFLLQFVEGTMTLGRAGDGGGVAVWAHIGGFVAGVLVVLLLRALGGLRTPPPSIEFVRRRFRPTRYVGRGYYRD